MLSVAFGFVNDCLHAMRHTFIKVLQVFPSDTPSDPTSDFFQFSFLLYLGPSIFSQIQFWTIAWLFLDQLDAIV